ncbi:MAG: hypothetical protein PHF84_07470 [bacterium]|nr:hypothetical protein [bacterium]
MKEELNVKLGLHRLSENERKQLFQKFIDAGGKVVDERPGSMLNFDRDKQRDLLKKLKEKEKRRGLKGIEELEEEELVISERKMSRNRNIWVRMKIYLKGLWHQVIRATGDQVSDTFFRFFRMEVIPNLKNFNFIIQTLYAGGDDLMKEVKKMLDAKEQYYYFLFEKYKNLFNEDEYNAILYFSNKKRFPRVKPGYLEEPMKKIMKKIYMLKGYMNGSFLTFKTALYVASKLKGWETRLYHKRLNQVKYSLNLIFLHLLPKFHSLCLLILGDNIPLNSKRIEKYLEIEEKDRVTYLLDKKEKESTMPLPMMPIQFKKIKTEEILYVPRNFTELNEDDFRKLELDIITVIGVKLMHNVDMEKIILENKEQFKLDRVPREDKIFLTFIFFKEFEKEYSFVLTSYKIIIKPLFEDNKRINYKDKLSALYTPFTNFNELFRDYFDGVHQLEELKADLGVNEITRYNRMTALESKRTKLGYEIKGEALRYFTELKQYLDKFINDYNTDKRIIENPDDELNFNVEVEGIKKVETKKIIDAIIDIDAFTSAMLFRLEEGGDLVGLSSEVKQIQVPDEKTAPPVQVPVEEEDNFFDELQYTLDKRRDKKENE